MSLSNKQLETLKRIKNRNSRTIDAAKLIRLFKAAGAIESDGQEYSGTRLEFNGVSAFIKKPEKINRLNRTTSRKPPTWNPEVVNMARLLYQANTPGGNATG